MTHWGHQDSRHASFIYYTISSFPAVDLQGHHGMTPEGIQVGHSPMAMPRGSVQLRTSLRKLLSNLVILLPVCHNFQCPGKVALLPGQALRHQALPPGGAVATRCAEEWGDRGEGTACYGPVSCLLAHCPGWSGLCRALNLLWHVWRGWRGMPLKGEAGAELAPSLPAPGWCKVSTKSGSSWKHFLFSSCPSFSAVFFILQKLMFTIYWDIREQSCFSATHF